MFDASCIMIIIVPPFEVVKLFFDIFYFFLFLRIFFGTGIIHFGTGSNLGKKRVTMREPGHSGRRRTIVRLLLIPGKHDTFFRRFDFA
jgi:hypothetical protein